MMSKPGKSNATTPEQAQSERPIAAPDLPYQPQDPRSYAPGIGLIGCGQITVEHLTAYKHAGYRVVALCDMDKRRADTRREEFYPEADVYTDYRRLLARDDIEVVDIATHPPQRPPLVRAAVEAGKHVLSQKPFVEDLDEGQRLIELADRHGVRLAVNQNGRWAPHFSYIRQAVARNLIGAVSGAHFAVHWDHSWVEGSEFENVRHLILYDFAIHWFDLLSCLMCRNTAEDSCRARDTVGPPAIDPVSQSPLRVYASFAHAGSQTVRPALLGQALVEYEHAQATLVFDGDTRFAPLDLTYVTGDRGTISSQGPDIRCQQVQLTTAAGTARPRLEGAWFPNGFHGTMGELLLAVEEDREPAHSAQNNLRSLELCFAAVASAERHQAVVPGTIRQMPGKR